MLWIQLLTRRVLMQENAARLKAYKAKLVIFPKRSNKPKSGDSSAEELKNVPQFKGTILPLVHEKPQLETVKLTDEHKVRHGVPHESPVCQCGGFLARSGGRGDIMMLKVHHSLGMASLR